MASIQKIKPFLWFDNQAEEAARHYTSIFKDSRIVDANPMVVTFELAGQTFLALNGGPRFKFTEAVSFMVSCADQAEVDYFWSKLTADGGEESMCGWLKDKFGLSWQIIPDALPRFIGGADREKAGRATQAMLQMRKIVIADLERAYNGA